MFYSGEYNPQKSIDEHGFIHKALKIRGYFMCQKGRNVRFFPTP
jgi:hypothetical protein